MLKMALIPIWIDKKSHASLEKMAERPVLIEVATLGTAFYGSMIRLTPDGARVLPDEPFLLRAKVNVKVMFRIANTEYTLSGITTANDLDDCILFDFDSVTRKHIAILSGEWKDAGWLQTGQMPIPAPGHKQKPAVKPAPDKAE
jgi:hypothetical protein